MNPLTQSLFVVALVFMVLSPAMAEQNALDRAQYMLRQINAQKVQLEQQNATLKQELDTLKNQSEKQLQKQKLGNKKLGKANQQKDDHIQKLRDKLRETLISLRESENERMLANRSGMAVNSQLQLCVANNHKLVALNADIVEQYETKGVWDALLQAEPFTKIEQVEIENIMQEYRFKNEDLELGSAQKYQQIGKPESRVSESQVDD